MRDRLPGLAARMLDTDRRGWAAVSGTAIFLVGAPNAGRLVDRDPTAAVARSIDRRACSRRRRTPHRTAWSVPGRNTGSHSRQITCMTKTEKRRSRRRQETADGRGRPRRYAPRSTRKRPTSSCSTCATHRHSPTSSCCVPGRAPGRSRRSPTPSRKRSARQRCVRRTSRATTAAEWILMDYFTFIVHVFTPQTRAFYSLERLWGDAERIEVEAIETCRRILKLPPSGGRRLGGDTSPTPPRRAAGAGVRGLRAPAGQAHARAGLRAVLAGDLHFHAAAL